MQEINRSADLTESQINKLARSSDREQARSAPRIHVPETAQEQMAIEWWERQPKENEKMFALFQMYRDEKQRSIKRLADEVKGYSPHKLYIISKQYLWEERARAYDNYVDRKKTENKINSTQSMLDRHSDEAKTAQKTLMLTFQELQKRIKENDMGDLSELSMSDLLRLAMQAADRMPKLHDAERKANGVPNELSSIALDVTSNGETMQPNINIMVNGSRSQLLNNININNNDNTAEEGNDGN